MISSNEGAVAMHDQSMEDPQGSIDTTLRGNAAPILTVQSLSCGYSDQAIIKDVSFEIYAGEILAIFGPNGVGKSTLFKTILGFLPSLDGVVYMDGEDVNEWSRKRIAQNLAYVPQSHTTGFGFLVREMVLMGRTPLIGGLSSPTKEDEAAAARVLEDLGIAHLAERNCTTLSGGELQMVLIARALAQNPRLLIMDEPCASLDLGNQVLVLNRIIELADRGLAIIITTHDPNHAFLLDSRVVCLQGKGEIKVGQATELITRSLLEELYGIEADIGVICAEGAGSCDGLGDVRGAGCGEQGDVRGASCGEPGDASGAEGSSVAGGGSLACMPRLKARSNQNLSQESQKRSSNE